MSARPWQLAARLGRALPASDIQRLADALQQGSSGVQQLLADANSPLLRDACRRLHQAGLSPRDGLLAAGALLAGLEPERVPRSVDVVWTGPSSPAGTYRLTSAVITDLIGQAEHQVLLVGYAVHSEASVQQALQSASDHGVQITLLLERHADNPSFSGSGQAFSGLDAERLCWPASQRPAGAALHAKILVVDDASALVGSANITGAALGHNLECGLLLRGGPEPAAIRAHISGLLAAGHLQRVASI